MRVYYYFAFVLVWGVAACSGTQMASERSGPTAGTLPPPAAAVDVPALMGRSIDQVRRRLGDPRETSEQAIGREPTAEQMKLTKGRDWINTFERNGNTMIVTFNANTRKVRDIVLVGSDEDALLRDANLSLTSPDYLVLPVLDPDNNAKTIGMRVVARR